MKKSVLSILKFILVSGILIFSSCEIGLGEAVDTEPPAITFAQPAADSIVREKFTMSGKWSDDLGIENIKVEFKDVNDGSLIYGPFEAELVKDSDSSGSWKCTVDPVKANIPDGTYVASAIALDTAEHDTITSTTFSVDNTAPLIVLESPSTTDIGNPNAYGQVFSVTGKAADDSDVDSIDFIFYDKNGSEIYRKNIKGVGTQLEVTVAEWGDEVYDKIYGKNKEAGTVPYYVGLIAYDGARKVPEEAGDKGNASTSFYLWDSLEEQLGTVKTSVGYKVLNGRSTISKSEKEEWLDALKKLKIEKATFSLNPVNNPYFEVSRFEGFKPGEEGLDLNNKQYEFTNKNTISINLFRGRDNKALKVDTIGVYLRECDSKGKLKNNGKTITILQPYTDKDGKVYKDNTGKPLISQAEHSSAIKTVDTSYSMSFAINNEVYTGIEFNKYYQVDVVGYDINKVEVFNESKYGLKMVTTANKPEILITTPANGGNIPKSAAYTVEGLVITTEDINYVAVYEEKVEDNTPIHTSKGASPEVTIGAYDKTKKAFPFSFVVNTKGKRVTGDVLPKYVVEVESSSKQYSTQEIKIDPLPPEIGECSITPEVEVGGETYVNGTIEIKQAISDNQMIKKAEYSLDDGETWISGSTSMLKFSVNTTKYTEKDAKEKFIPTDKTIKIRITDTAGNISEGDINLKIDQSTDAPKIALTNAKESVTAEGNISTSQNLFGSVTNNQLLGTISDDDGIDKITISVKKSDDTDYSSFAAGSESKKYTEGYDVGGSTTKSIAFTLPKEEGTYKIQIKVEDKKKEKTGYNTSQTKEFLVAVDNGAPNLTISTPSGEGAYKAANASFELEGTTNDKDAKIGVFKDVNCETVLKTGSDNISPDGTGKWSYTVATGTEGSTFYVRAIDKYGQSTTEKFVYNIDAAAPTFRVTKVGNGEDNGVTDAQVASGITKYASATSLYTVRGTVIDEGPSGLADNLYYNVSATEPEKDESGKFYIIDKEKGWKPAIISKNPDKTQNSEWVANIDLGEKEGGNRKYEEGHTYNLYLAVTDNANNTSLISANKASNAIKFTLDSISPKVIDLGLEDEGSKSYAFVYAKDEESSIPDENVKLLYNKIIHIKTPGISDGTGVYAGYKKYRFEIDLKDISSSSTSVKYTISVTDAAGNSTVPTEKDIDNSAPTISFNKPGSSGHPLGDLYRNGEYYYTNKDIKIGYLVQALGNGLNSFKYQENDKTSVEIYDGTGRKTKLDGTSAADAITISKPASSVSVINKFTAENKYGTSAEAELKYIFDLNPPALNITNTFKTSDNYIDGTKILLINGTASDSTSETTDSGLSEVRYSLISGKKTSWNNSWDSSTTGMKKFWDYVQGTLNWKLNLDLSEYDEGDYTLFIKSIDNVGNESEIKVVNLVADMNKPQITSATKVNDFTKQETTVSGSVTETYLKKLSLAVTKNGTAYNGITLTGPDAGNNWSFKIPKSEGDWEFTLTATDKTEPAGKTDVKTWKTTVDETKPTYTISTPIAEDASKDVIKYFTDVNSPVTIGGTVTDKNISGVYYKLSSTAEVYTAAATGWTETTITAGDNAGDPDNWSSKFYWTDITKDQYYVLNIAAVDKAGNISDAHSKVVKFYPDSAKPDLQMTNAEAIITNDAITVSGTLTEANLKSFKYTATKTAYGAGKTPVTYDVTSLTKVTPAAGANTDSAWSLTLPKTAGDAIYNITIEAKDIADQIVTKTAEIKLDTTKPVLKAGEAIKLNKSDYNSEAPAWYNSTSLDLSGTYTEDGIGFEQGYYFINPETVPTPANISTQISSATGTFGVNTDGTFSLISSGLNSGNNTVYIATRDKAGNFSAITPLTVKVDTVAPKLTAGTTVDDELKTRILSNAKKGFVIKGNVKDETGGSGIATVYISLGGSTYDLKASLTDAENGKDFTYTMDKSKLTESCTVYVRIVDNAGNITDKDLFQLTIDTNAPEIKINPITDADIDADGTQVNKTISISGTASDNNSLESVSELQISSDYNAATPDSATWTALSTSNAGTNYALTGTTNWTAANFDTTKFADGTYFIRAKAIDEAGNTGYSTPVEIKIDQNSDRPVIKIPSLAGTSASVQSATIMGTVSDDDGVESFEYSIDDGSTWENVPVTSGSWKFTLEADTYEIYFKIKDRENEYFTTKLGASDEELKRPYIVFEDGTKKDNTAALKLSVDLKAPDFTTIQFAKLETAEKELSKFPVESAWKESGKITFSPSKPYMYANIVLNEDVSMNDTAKNDISISIGDTVLEVMAGGKFTNDAKKGDCTYKIGPIDLKSYIVDAENKGSKDGTKTVTLTATDKSGRTSTKTFIISTDETAPTVSINYPTASDEISGKVTLLGSFSDSTGISLETGHIQYLIPTKEQQAAGANLSGADWKDITVAGNLFASMKLPFESSSYTKPAADSGKDSLIYYATNSSYATPDENGIVELPIYFKTTDTVGNTAIDKSNTIVLNPDAGIPTVELTSHSDKAKTAGIVNLMGSAADDEKVDSVKITKLEYATAETIDDWKTVSDTTVAGLVVTGKGTAEENGVIKCVGTTGWKASIDTSKIASDVTAIRVTVESFDENGTSSNKTHMDGKTQKTCETRILVDKSVPKLESASIVGFEDTPENATDTPSFEKTYSSGMYISKNNAAKLYFKAVISDDSSVTGIDFTCNEGSAVSTTDKLEIGLDTKKYTVLLPIKVEDDAESGYVAEGHIYATLEMLDGQHTDVTQNFSFYIDNTAPKMYSKSGDSYVANDKINNEATLRLENNSGLVVNTENVVENSDGSYTFGDSVEEAGSGLAYVVYWFGKADSKGKTNRVYNPMFNNGSNNNKTVINGTTVKLNSENLPVLVQTVSRSAENKVSYADLRYNKNIRVGGLVKLGGSYHLISEISGNVATLADSIDKSYTNAEFVYAQVVDHQVTEGFASNGTVSNDDGDGMVEMVKQTGTTYKWSSSILSDKIEDGPAEIHVTVFDAAGNVNSGYVKTSIQNNRPRIARVFLGTDLNGNGKFDYYSPNATGAVLSTDKRDATGNGTEFGELSFYSALSTDGKLQGNVTIDSSSFVVSGDFLVLPEIVGGNGTLKYNYMVADTEGEATSTSDVDALEELSSDVETLQLQKRADSKQDVAAFLGTSNKFDGYNYSETATKYDETNHNGTKSGSLKGLVIKKGDLETHESWTTAGGKKNKYFAFTFWDETGVSDGLTQGKDTLNAVLKVPVVINVVDDVKPTANIKPFYWNSKEDSSFVYDENGNPQGHIDIDDGTGTTNPGVAGRVYIEGTAKDETRLGALYFTEPNGKVYKIAKYTDGAWVNTPSGVEEDGIQAAWVNIKNVWVETISEPSQAGHEVAWKVEIDMTPNGIATDKTVDITAKDAASTANTSASSTTQTIDPEKKDGGELTSHYIMDFVPYIKSIYPANGSANRSRLGKYSVRAGEDMIIEGMNFAKGASYTVVFKKTGAVTGDNGGYTTKPTNWSGTIAKDGKITVTAPLNSRYVEVTLNGVTTKNNTNTNDGYNIEAGYLAKDPQDAADEKSYGAASANKNGTNFWTDDRYISVWKVGTTFTGSEQPHDGSIEKGTATTVKYTGSTKGSIGTDNKLFAIWGSDKNMVYDEVYGGTRSYSLIGTQSSGFFYGPPTQTDIAVVGNRVFYAILDNGVKDADTFGSGLYLTREGKKMKNQLDGGQIAQVEQQTMLNQFRNPKVAGCLEKSSTGSGRSCYMYMTYYDYKTHCLKYAHIEYRQDEDYNNWEDAIKYFTNNKKSTGLSGSIVIAGENSTSSEVDVGTWSDVKVDTSTSTPIPVVTYYSKSAGKLYIVRATKTIPTSAADWGIPIEVASPSGVSDFGRYVSMEMSTNGDLFITAQDADSSRLYYMHYTFTKAESGNGGTYTRDVINCIDAVNGAGRWTDIKLTDSTKVGKDAGPVIIHQDPTKLNTKNALKLCTLNGENWDSMYVPSNYEPEDTKLSLVLSALDPDNVTDAVAVGYNSNNLCVDFLRGE